MSGRQTKTCGQITGRTTKAGQPCKIPLRGGKCMTHDCAGLSARNKAVAASFKASNPDAFAAQRSAAGKLGFQATGGMHGWAKANEFARRWRLKHPSGPERKIIEILEQLGFTDCEREYALPDGKSIDFACPVRKIGIEANGHQHKASFGEDEPRADRQKEKIDALIADGWNIIVVEADGKSLPQEKVDEFAKVLKELFDGACEF